MQTCAFDAAVFYFMKFAEAYIHDTHLCLFICIYIDTYPHKYLFMWTQSINTYYSFQIYFAEMLFLILFCLSLILSVLSVKFEANSYTIYSGKVWPPVLISLFSENVCSPLNWNLIISENPGNRHHCFIFLHKWARFCLVFLCDFFSLCQWRMLVLRCIDQVLGHSIRYRESVRELGQSSCRKKDLL
jgi:hypothetical protein